MKIIIFISIISILIFLKKRYLRVIRKKIIPSSIILFKEKEFNPDISTDNWDLHKLRLEKFRRSQYKGLTFFLSSENRIYYITEEGNKVYC